MVLFDRVQKLGCFRVPVGWPLHGLSKCHDVSRGVAKLPEDVRHTANQERRPMSDVDAVDVSSTGI